MRPIVRRVERLQRLAVFEAAARCGSFTAAAAELGMTQPAVTRQIRSLERALGVDLFRRSANRSELTEVGTRFLSHVAAGFDLIESGVEELSEHSGTFVLATHPGIAQQWLVPRLDELQAVLGDLDLRLWLFGNDGDLLAGGYDAALRVGLGEFAGQDSRLIFPERVIPVASAALAAEYGLGPHSTAHDVYRAPFIHMDDGDQPWMSWSDWLRRFGISLRRQPGRVLYNNYPVVVQQVLAGRGIGLGWRPLIDDLLEGEGLVPVGPEITSNRGYYLTWPTGSRTSIVEAVERWLLASVEASGDRTDSGPRSAASGSAASGSAAIKG